MNTVFFLKSPTLKSLDLRLAFVLFCSISFADSAQAVSLGAIRVLSSIGQPLSAQIDLNDLAPGELEQLRVVSASPQDYRTAGLEPSALASGLTVQPRTEGGRNFLQVTSSQPASEPFADLLLDMQSLSGRMLKQYTVLIDPVPNAGTSVAASNTAASHVQVQQALQQVLPASQAAANADAQIPPAFLPAPTVARSASPSPSNQMQAPSLHVSGANLSDGYPPAFLFDPATLQGSPSQAVTVRAGDTAASIANRYRRSDVTLEAMLAAMAQRNPDTFERGAKTVLKAGDVLQIPSELSQNTANPVASTAARAELPVLIPARNFSSYRSAAASRASVRKEGAGRVATGSVAKVEAKDARKDLQAADKLTLSKGTLPTKAASTQAEKVDAKTAEAIAQNKRQAAQNERSAELNKNMSDLSAVQKKLDTPNSKDAVVSNAKGVTQTAPKPNSAANVPVSTKDALLGGEKPLEVTSAPAVSSPSTPQTPSAQSSPSADGVAQKPVSSALGIPASNLARETAATKPTEASSVAVAVPGSAAGVTAKPAAAAPVQSTPPSFIDELLDNPMLPVGGLGIVGLLGGWLWYRRRPSKNMQEASSFYTRADTKESPDSYFGKTGGKQIDTNVDAASSMAYSPSQLATDDEIDPIAEADVYVSYGRELQAIDILKDATKNIRYKAQAYEKLLKIYGQRGEVAAYDQYAAEFHQITRGFGPQWQTVAQEGIQLNPNNPLYASAKNTASAVQSHSAGSLPKPKADVGLPAIAASLAAPVSGAKDSMLHLDMAELSSRIPENMSGGSSFGSGVSSAQPPLAAPMMSTPAFDMDKVSLHFDSIPEAAHTAGLATSFSNLGFENTGTTNPLETKLTLADEFFALGDREAARTLVQEVIAQAGSGTEIGRKAQDLVRRLG